MTISTDGLAEYEYEGKGVTEKDIP
jgi:hypothetical protein